MSFRREPKTIDERVAALEAGMRQARTSIAVDVLGVGIDPNVIEEKGDLIVGLAPGAVDRLGPGDEGSILTIAGGTPEWSDSPVDDVTMLVWLGGPS